MSVEEYLRLIEAVNRTQEVVADVKQEAKDVIKTVKKAKRKASGYSKKYKSAFAKVKSKYKTKSGKWKKDGFKKAVRAAHRMAGGK